MRVLFSSTPAFGHLLPLLPLARAAQASGAEVAVATAPTLREVVAPLTLLPAGPPFPDIAAEFYRLSGSPEVTELDPVAFGQLFGAVRIDLTFDEALAAGRALGADLVVAEREDTVGPMVAAALGVPWARFLLGANLPPETAGAISAAAEERYAARGLEVALPVAVLDPWPMELQPPGWRPASRRVVVRPEPHAGSDPDVTRPAAPPDGRPRVLVTPGTIADDVETVAALVGSLVDLDVDLVLTDRHGQPWPLDVDPERVRQVGFVPLARLLEGVDVAVVAGGSGTIAGTLARGVPMVVLPLVFDQAGNADRAAATGAAIVATSPEEVGAAVKAVLADTTVRTAARCVAGRIAAMDPPERAWQRLLELTRERGTFSQR